MSTQCNLIHLDSLPPSVNRIWRVSNGTHHLSNEYGSWKAAAVWQVRGQCKEPVEGPFAISITMKRQRRNQDLDNRLKALLDTLQAGGAFTDDRYAQSITLQWAPDLTSGPMVFVRVMATEERPVMSAQKKRRAG